MELVAYHAKHHFNVVRGVFILRVSAQLLVFIFGVGLWQQVKIAVPLSVAVLCAREEVFAQVAKVVGGTVAPAVAVVIFIAKLQEGGLPQWLAVGGLCCVAPLLCGCNVEAVGLIGRVVTQLVFYLIEVYVVGRQTLAITLVVRHIAAHSNVSAHAV